MEYKGIKCKDIASLFEQLHDASIFGWSIEKEEWFETCYDLAANLFILSNRVEKLEDQQPYDVRFDKTNDFHVVIKAHTEQIKLLQKKIEDIEQETNIKKIRKLLNEILQFKSEKYPLDSDMLRQMIKEKGLEGLDDGMAVLYQEVLQDLCNEILILLKGA